MVIAWLALLAISEPCLSMKTASFAPSRPPSTDILDLHYEFILSKSNSSTSRVEGNVRSRAECSMLCLAVESFECVAFAYSSRKDECLLSSILDVKKWNTSDVDLFKKIPECPNNFVRVGSRCYNWIIGSFNFVEARRACNSLNSHPIVVDSPMEMIDIETFVSLARENATFNKSTCIVSRIFTWTSATTVRPTGGPFVWKPYRMGNNQEPYLPIRYLRWKPGEPKGTGEFCAEMFELFTFNNNNCLKKRCVICEIDMF